MSYKVTETITDNGKVVKKSIFEFETESAMKRGVSDLKIKFNEERFAAVLNGRGILYANMEQHISVKNLQ